MLAAQMEARRSGERDEEFKPVRRGWFLGDKQFRKDLLAQMAERRGEWHYGEELQESAEARAEKIIGGDSKAKGGLRTTCGCGARETFSKCGWRSGCGWKQR